MVAFGSSGIPRPAGADVSMAPRRYRGQSAWASRRQTSSCWRRGCGRGAPTAMHVWSAPGTLAGAMRVPCRSRRRNGQTDGSRERAMSSDLSTTGRVGRGSASSATCRGSAVRAAEASAVPEFGRAASPAPGAPGSGARPPSTASSLSSNSSRWNRHGPRSGRV